MIFRDSELLFRGSKERLKRNVAKQGGTFPAPGTFRILWRSPYFKYGLSFRMTGFYQTTENGIRIRYRFRPAVTTALWVSIPMLFLLTFAAWEIRDGNGQSAAAVFLFSFLYPSVAAWQFVSCHKTMVRFFNIATQ